MSWPKGRPRPRKVTSEGATVVDESPMAEEETPATHEQCGVQVPLDWRKGALLNVRNHGDSYVITLYPDEFRPEQPERALRFTNLGECQDFVSRWYAAEHHDPRAR